MEWGLCVEASMFKSILTLYCSLSEMLGCALYVCRTHYVRITFSPYCTLSEMFGWNGHCMCVESSVFESHFAPYFTLSEMLGWNGHCMCVEPSVFESHFSPYCTLSEMLGWNGRCMCVEPSMFKSHFHPIVHYLRCWDGMGTVCVSNPLC